MGRKKIVKQLMALGIGRNAANWLAINRRYKIDWLISEMATACIYGKVTGAFLCRGSVCFRVRKDGGSRYVIPVPKELVDEWRSS